MNPKVKSLAGELNFLFYAKISLEKLLTVIR